MNRSHDEPASTTVYAPGESVLAGLLNRQQLAEQFNCGERTIIRRERAGMPFIAVGMTRLYDPARVREWLMSQGQGHTAPKRERQAVAA